MDKALPILTYHHVNPVPDDMVTVTPEHFERQLAFLSRKGYRTVFADEIGPWMAGNTALEQRTVALTFDDGYRDNLQFAFPLLKKYRMKATIFLVTGWAALPGAGRRKARVLSHQECRNRTDRGKGADVSLNWDEARRLEASGLIRFESHSHRHRKGLFADPHALEEDLRLSQESLERYLGKKSRCLCWPGGRYNDHSLEVARRLGFESCCTTERGVNSRGDDPWRLKRVTVKDAGPGWLAKTLFIFSRPRLGRFYASLKSK